jgi:hypothetical protein
MVHVRNNSDITNALRHWITAKKGFTSAVFASLIESRADRSRRGIQEQQTQPYNIMRGANLLCASAAGRSIFVNIFRL